MRAPEQFDKRPAIDNGSPRPRRAGVSRIGRLAIAFLAVSVASLALGVAVTSLIKSPAEIASQTAPPPLTTLTVPITSGTLSDTVLLSGILSPGRVTGFTPPAPAGTDAVVTALPVQVDATVGPGSLLLGVSDRPLILLYGDIPMIRDLASGDTGPDVSRLQDSLRGAGLVVADKSGVFGRSTQHALTSLYLAVGYPAPVDASRRPQALRSELAVAPAGDFGRVVSLGSALGDTVTAPAIQVATTASVVTAQVSALGAKRLAIGMKVSLTGTNLPDPVQGTIRSLGKLAKNDQGGMSLPITVAPDSPLPVEVLEGDSLQISAEFSTDSEPGLLAPLAAIYSDSKGTTSVMLVEGDSSTRVAVAVVGSGDGMVMFVVSDASLKAGDLVRLGFE